MPLFSQVFRHHLAVWAIIIPRPSEIALSAFAASCCAAEDEARNILGDPSAVIHLLDAAVEEFAAEYGSTPCAEDRHLQAKWTEVANEAVLSALCSRLSHSEVDVIRLAHTA